MLAARDKRLDELDAPAQTGGKPAMKRQFLRLFLTN
jgi:hypothetical protein